MFACRTHILTGENGSGALKAFELYDDLRDPIGTLRSDDHLYYYTDDSRGSIINLVDENGEAVVSYTYTDYGETTESQGSSIDNEVRFTGGICDEETGLYYLNARFYDPSTGRFLNPDSYRGEAADPMSLHLYAYCANNPVNMVDPTGHAAETVLDVVFLGISLKEYLEAPSVTTFAYVVWDGVATVMPLVPGSYTARGAKYLSKAAISEALWKSGIQVTTKGAIHAKAIKTGKKVAKTVSVKKSSKVAKKAGIAVTLSKSTLKHPLNRHVPKRFAMQLKYLSLSKAEKIVSKRTFFNKNWSEEKVIRAINAAYAKALKKGIVNEPYIMTYAGEKIAVVINEKGELMTAYGMHHYSLNELKKLL